MDFRRVAIEILDECDRSPASLKSILRKIEREAVLAALNEKKNIAQAAVALRLNRTTVMEMLKRLGIKAWHKGEPIV
jgi:transcriptional regulator with GAF, ATPase, and Fis domain